jgi:ABC-type glycerol-3-phosphate transport system substrate-binding protein
VILLAGCSGSDADGSGGDGESNSGGTTGSGSRSADTTTVDWWHAMSGALGQVVEDFAADFNEQADGTRVETSYQGGYVGHAPWRVPDHPPERSP